MRASRAIRRLINGLIAYLPLLGLVVVLWTLGPSAAHLTSVHWGPLAQSVAVLLLAFTVLVPAWKLWLPVSRDAASWRLCFVSLYRPTLAKYLPGKIWNMLGSVEILAIAGIPRRQTAKALGIFQIALFGSGLFVSALPLSLPGNRARIWAWLGNVAPDAGTVWALFGLASLAVSLLAWKYAGKARPLLAACRRKRKKLLATLAWCVLHWLFLVLAFEIFFAGLNLNVPWSLVALQPLSNNLGLLALVAPGGLGVREAFTAMYLGLLGVDLQAGIIVAIQARLWFILVEVLLWLCALLLAKRNGIQQA